MHILDPNGAGGCYLNFRDREVRGGVLVGQLAWKGGVDVLISS